LRVGKLNFFYDDTVLRINTVLPLATPQPLCRRRQRKMFPVENLLQSKKHFEPGTNSQERKIFLLAPFEAINRDCCSI